MKKHFLLPALLLTALTTAQAQQLPQGVTRVASVEGLTEYRLTNGLRAVFFPDPSKSTITVNITYNVGSRHENYGETGMAHIVEHLMSYGSPRHPDAKREQSERGASRNASTWDDRTNYYETFPASDANLDWAFDLESDRMLNAYVRKDILDSQMSVVRNEFESGENNPQRVLSQRIFSTAFLWHNYGKSTIGAKSDIENVPIDRLTAFYKRYYRPDNAVLVVSGRFDEAKALALLAQKFGPLTTPSTPIPATYTREPVQDGERSVVLRRTGDIQLLTAVYHIPATAHPDAAALDLLSTALAFGPASRLQKALVETKKAATASSDTRLMLESGILSFSSTIRKESPFDAAKEALLAVLDGIAASPITAEETARAKAQGLSTYDLLLANSTQTAMELTEWIAAGDWRLFFTHRDGIRNATAADLQRVALKYMKPSNRTIGSFIPEDNPQRAEIPPPPDLVTLLRDYKGDPPVSMGEAFEPSIANIESRMIRSKLPNGTKVSLLPKKNRGGATTATIRINYGDNQTLPGQSGIAALVRASLMRGTAKHTRQQIQDELSRLKSQITVGGALGITQLSIQTTGANLEATLRLAAEILKEPAFPPSEFEQARQAQLAALDASRTDPATLAPIALTRRINPYQSDSPFYTPTVDESIAQMQAATLDAAKAFHADLYGASAAQIAIAGEFDTAAVTKLSSELFGTWNNKRPYAESSHIYSRTEAAQPTIAIRDKANATVTAGQAFPVSQAHADYPALLLANYMMGGHSTSRLYVRIRGKEGLSYGVSSSLSADPKDNSAEWIMSAITNPTNAPKLIQVFQEEVAQALKDGFTPEEITAAKKGWSETRTVQRNQDTALAARIIVNDHNGRTLAFDGDLETKVAALTPEQINTTFRRYLDPARLVIIKAGDFPQ